MKLYMVPAAPNPSKVTLYVAEKEATGVDLGLEQVMVNPIKNEQRSAEHLARNPFGTLPVLELDDGSYLIESLAIIEFLEELHPQPSFWGDDPVTRGRARDVERTIATRLLGPVADFVHATNSPLGLPEDPERAASVQEHLPVAWRYVEDLLSDEREFVAGPAVTVGDVTLAACLQFMRFAGFELIADYPRLVKWDLRFRARPGPASVLRF